MKSLRITVLLLLIITACRTARHVPPAITNTRSEYIAQYSDLAIREMRRTGIPASIKMAQAILESGDGNSTLARRANNHFGIKCHEWTGRRIYHDDDERNECFRRYSSVEDSYRDHSEFLTGRSRYAGLFELDPHDYRAWARGLRETGYATNPQYDRLLIRIIEDNELYLLDRGSGLPSGGRGVTLAEAETTVPASAGEADIRVHNRIRYIIASDGDTHESLTRELGLMRWELPHYNDFPEGHRIQSGDIIYIQPKRRRAERGADMHVTNAGETMWDISQQYGVRLNRLLRRNNMQEGQEPPPGDTIYLRRNKPVQDRDRSPGLLFTP